MKTNIAVRVKSYYESKDFLDMYKDQLYEQYHYNKGDIISRIFDLFMIQNYETESKLENFKPITIEQAKQIYQLIYDNLELFTDTFKSYYVGYTSLESVSFGEQEEELDNVYNHMTKKKYTIKYLKRIFGEEGFYVSKNSNYAYYDLSSHGLHIDLLNNHESIILLDNFLLTI